MTRRMAQQLDLFIDTSKVVNVASVKHRSPFRYPGGKTWLVPRIIQWLKNKEVKPEHFIEPFAGGAIIGLTVAFENLASHVTIIELDAQVASVWETIFTNSEGEWLAKRIETFEFNAENVNSILQGSDLSIRDKAFQTILQNRTAHGGILAPGAGLLKHGENGKGIASRWYPQTLARRIRDLITIRDRITFFHGDAFPVIENYTKAENAVFFVDPPYTAGNGKRAGSRLYNHFLIDHERLFSLFENSQADFILTYDNDEYIVEMANRHHLDYSQIAMQNTHLSKMTELVLGKNLSWMRDNR